MTLNEISQGVKIAISNASNTTPNQIQDKDKISKYVPAVAKLALVLKIKNQFPLVDETEIANSLYDSINKVNELIDYINSIYNPSV